MTTISKVFMISILEHGAESVEERRSLAGFKEEPAHGYQITPGGEAGDAYHLTGAGRVDELVCADVYANVMHWEAEYHQIRGLDPVGWDGCAGLGLVTGAVGNAHAMLEVDIARESGAVKSRAGSFSTPYIGDAQVGCGGLHHLVQDGVSRVGQRAFISFPPGQLGTQFFFQPTSLCLLQPSLLLYECGHATIHAGEDALSFCEMPFYLFLSYLQVPAELELVPLALFYLGPELAHPRFLLFQIINEVDIMHRHAGHQVQPTEEILQTIAAKEQLHHSVFPGLVDGDQPLVQEVHMRTVGNLAQFEFAPQLREILVGAF